jgi:hypothetical protein
MIYSHVPCFHGWAMFMVREIVAANAVHWAQKLVDTDRP